MLLLDKAVIASLSGIAGRRQRERAAAARMEIVVEGVESFLEMFLERVLVFLELVGLILEMLLGLAPNLFGRFLDPFLDPFAASLAASLAFFAAKGPEPPTTLITRSEVTFHIGAKH